MDFTGVEIAFVQINPWVLVAKLVGNVILDIFGHFDQKSPT